MIFDIINLTWDEVKALNDAQMKLLRAAQKKKNDLVAKAQKELKQFRNKINKNGMKHSTLYERKKFEVEDGLERTCIRIADQLMFEMSLCETKSEGSSGGSSDDSPYLVDYSLSYNERYKIVRNYYLTFKDPNERMAKYAADEVAKKYLGSYYETLYNILATYEK